MTRLSESELLAGNWKWVSADGLIHIHCDDMLKDCEKYLNHNTRVYKAYLATLTAEEGKDE